MKFPTVLYWSGKGLVLQTSRTRIVGLVNARVELVPMNEVVWMIDNPTPSRVAARILAAQAVDLGCSDEAAAVLNMLGSWELKGSPRYQKPVRKVQRKTTKVQTPVKVKTKQRVLKLF